MTLRDFGGGFIDGDVVLGRAPVWTLGLPSDGVMVLHPTSGGAPFPSSKVMWIVGPNQTRPVVVRGTDTSTGDPLWLEVCPCNLAPGGPPRYATKLTFDPAKPNRGYAQNSAGNWAIWGIGVGARAAGCYSLVVRSGEGSWAVRLAIGG